MSLHLQKEIDLKTKKTSKPTKQQIIELLKPHVPIAFKIIVKFDY